MRVLLLLLVPACSLGGTGRPDDNGDDDGGVDKTACAEAMTGAPLSPAGFDFHDALPTVDTVPRDGRLAIPSSISLERS